MDIRRLHMTSSDLKLAGMIVSPVWMALGIAAGDAVMVVAASALALISTMQFTPVLAELLRGASAAQLQRSRRSRALVRVLLPLRARA
jgi:hypothetical protein